MALNKINLRQIEPITGIGDNSNSELVAKIKYDILTVTGTEETPQTVFNLTATPNDTLVKLNVNGVDYFENICFNVDRDNNTITWTATKDNGGIDFNTSSMNVVAEYWIETTKGFDNDTITFGNGTKLTIIDNSEASSQTE